MGQEGQVKIHGGIFFNNFTSDIRGSSRVTTNNSLTQRHVKAYCFNVIMFALLIPTVIGLSLDVIIK